MLDFNNLPPRVDRRGASEYLDKTHGVVRAPSTLAKLACLGGGPRFRRVGSRRVTYDIKDLDRWAEELLGDPVRHTSEKATSASALPARRPRGEAHD